MPPAPDVAAPVADGAAPQPAAVAPTQEEDGLLPPDWKPNVNKYITYDANISYTGFKNLGLTFGIKNLLNEDPPFSAAYDSNTGAGSSWEPRVADPRGRAYQVTVNYKFW